MVESGQRGIVLGVVAVVVAVMVLVLVTPLAEALDGCSQHPTFGNISGSRDTAVLSGKQAARCRAGSQPVSILQTPKPYYSDQIVCSTDPVYASEGLCSATPCPTSFFALRTLHLPDGRVEAAGSHCVTLNQAAITPELLRGGQGV